MSVEISPNLQKALVSYKGVQVAQSAQSQNYAGHTNNWRVVNYPNPPVAQLTTNSSTPITWSGIDCSAVQQIQLATMRFRITVASNSVTILPTPLWFQRVEIQLDGQTINTLYADQLNEMYTTLFTDEKFSYLKKLLGYSIDSYCRNGIPLTASSNSYYFYLPLIGSYFDIANPLGAELGNNRLTMVFYPINSGIQIAGSGTLSLDAVDMIFTERDLASSDMQRLLQQVSRVPSKNRVLEPIPITWSSNYTFTSGSETLVDLNNIRGPVSHITFRLRATGSALVGGSSTNVFSNLDLGENGLISIKDSAGTDILTHANALRGDNYRGLEMSRQFNGLTRNRYTYTIPFGNIQSAMMLGTASGYQFFPKDRKFSLAITPDSIAGVNEVHTVTMSGTNNSGAYFFQWNGCQSNSIAFGTNVGTMASTLAGMDCFARFGLVAANFTCSATAAGSFTITINLQNSQVPSLAEIAGPIKIGGNLNATGVFDATTSAITTYGRRGWSTNGIYCVDILAYRFRDLITGPGVGKAFDADLNPEL
jgi:hypothetical protein